MKRVFYAVIILREPGFIHFSYKPFRKVGTVQNIFLALNNPDTFFIKPTLAGKKRIGTVKVFYRESLGNG